MSKGKGTDIPKAGEIAASGTETPFATRRLALGTAAADRRLSG
jgi:hypothetical protein